VCGHRGCNGRPLEAAVEKFRQDLRFGIRMLSRHRGFTAAALLMLALGIGANVVVFSLAETMYFKRLAVGDADRLVTVFGAIAGRRSDLAVSLNEFRYVRDHARTLSDVAAHYSNAPINLVDRGDSREINGSVVTASFFQILRLNPTIGRFFLPTEDTVAGRDPVAVISHSLWQRQFDADPGVLGRAIRLNGTLFTVVGVAPPGFAGVSPGGLATEVWIPSAMFHVGYRYCDALADPDCRIVRLLARLSPTASVRDAATEVTGLAAQLAAASPAANRDRGMSVAALVGATQELGADEARVPMLLAAAVGAVLLIACANLAGLLLARVMTRTREFGIRLALGASRARVVRQLMTEGFLLALLGGALGLLVAFWAKDLLGNFYAFNSEGQRANFTLDIDARAAAFTIALSLLTVLVFGLVPALQATRPDVVPALKDSAATMRASRLRGALVVAQVTCCIVLLSGAALLLRSMTNIYRGPGYDPNGVVLLRLRPSLVAQAAGRAESFQREVISRLQRLPGVVSASPAWYAPLPHWGGESPLWLPGRPPASGQPAYLTWMNAVGPGYLRTIELPLIAGREFDEGDRKESPRVAIVNEVVARALWPDGSGLGSQFVMDGKQYRVVGIVKAAQYHVASAAPQPFVFTDYWQMDGVGTVPIDSRTHVRVTGDPRRMLPLLRREILAIDPSVPISEDRLLTEWLDYSFRSVRATAAATAVFAILALLLSVIGLYAVVAATVTHRTKEIALRIALGAARGDVGRLVLGQGLRLVLGGIAAGAVATFGATRLLTAYLYGVGAHDPAAVMIAAGVLGVTALGASYIPARRAMAVDPIQALRAE
jgi:putative ABC transport system permease protein